MELKLTYSSYTWEESPKDCFWFSQPLRAYGCWSVKSTVSTSLLYDMSIIKTQQFSKFRFRQSLVLSFVFLLDFWSLFNFFFNNLFLELNLKVLNAVDTLNQLLESVLLSFEKLLNLLLVILHPLDKLSLSFRFFLKSFLFDQFLIQSLLVSKILLIYASPDLGCRASRGYWYLSLVNLPDSWKVFGCPEVPIASETWDLPSLGIIHFCIFDGSVIISSKLFDPYLPMIQLTQQSVDVVV